MKWVTDHPALWLHTILDVSMLLPTASVDLTDCIPKGRFGLRQIELEGKKMGPEPVSANFLGPV